MREPFFPIESLRLFSADGQVYRALDHLVAARSGTLLLVPPRLVVGDLAEVVDGCPVPHEEVYAVLEYKIRDRMIHKQWNGLTKWIDKIAQLECLGIDPGACEMDHITPMVNGEKKVLRMLHPCGVRYAVVIP